MPDKRLTLAAARAEAVTMIELFEVTLADDSVLRFTPSHPVSVGFAGAAYLALPITAKGFRWSAHGASPRPVLEMSNHGGLFSGQLDHPDLVGQPVVRMLTLLDECDAPLGDGGGASFTPERWIIERVARLDEVGVVMELAAEADLENLILPARVMLADLCQHRYRRWDLDNNQFDYTKATCPYTGKSGFDANGLSVTDQSKDVCSLRLSTGCKKRFSRQFPFLGFPGLG
ncbi:phage minor tail protein L [Alphaproteobacteria bacterium]|nr:phage minor tail protein L [Alphaproteobacteria bacterium]